MVTNFWCHSTAVPLMKKGMCAPCTFLTYCVLSVGKLRTQQCPVQLDPDFPDTPLFLSQATLFFFPSQCLFSPERIKSETMHRYPAVSCYPPTHIPTRMWAVHLSIDSMEEHWKTTLLHPGDEEILQMLKLYTLLLTVMVRTMLPELTTKWPYSYKTEEELRHFMSHVT